MGGGEGHGAAANGGGGLGVENGIRQLDQVAGRLHGDGEPEVGAEEVGGVSEGGDFAILQVAGWNDFEGAVLAEFAEFRSEAFEESFAEGGEFGVGVRG